MSLNYEVLLRADREEDVFLTSVRPAVPVDGDYAPLELKNPAHKQIVRLVQRVFLSTSTALHRLVVFTAIEHGNGCSWICAHAAQTLAAQTNGSVCLVDANLRSPSLHRHFGMDNIVGLSEALLESGPIRGFAQQVNGRNLWLLTWGSSSSNHFPVNGLEPLHSRLLELRSQFDYVLIDAPPVSLYADAILLGEMADGLVLVLEAHVTRRDTARKVEKNLKEARVKLLGAVLNKRTFPIPEGIFKRL